MAKFCVVCGSLCAYFLIFFRITPVSSFDGYYFYNSEAKDPSSEYHFTTKLLDGEEQFQFGKGDVENNQNDSPTSDDTIGTQNQSGSAADGVSVVNKALTDTNISSLKTKLQVQDPQKNLVMNGSDQYINVTSTKPRLQINATTVKNVTEENITVKKYATDDESEAFNRTLAKHNITTTKMGSHIYYNSSLRTNPEVGHNYWVDLANRSGAKVNELSASHRRAVTVQLSFEFPFYGHLIKNVTIATGGFLYTGDYVHSWLAATQYIAPLMANFDMSISNDSHIRYVDNGTAFTVEWEKVALRDEPNVGEFTFQTTLHKNGDIVFVYQNVPLLIENIDDHHHPVKVGLSDAYIIKRTMFFVRRKTVYEYHRIHFAKEDIKNWTVIYLTALPTCLQNENCSSCTTSNIPLFDCQWCSSLYRCSNGIDRNRQDWLVNRCEEEKIANESSCPNISNKNNVTNEAHTSDFQGLLKTDENPLKLGILKLLLLKNTSYEHHNTLANSVHTERCHSVEKRDVQNNQSNSPMQPNSTTLLPMPNDTIGAQNHTDSVSIVNKTLTDNKISTSKSKLEKPTKLIPPLIINKGQLQDPQKNLGVNGSGQYINVTSTKSQLEMNSTSTFSVDQNATTVKNETEDITIKNWANDDDGSEAFNKTLTEHNITTIQEASHIYYNSTLKTDPEVGHNYWVDLANRSDAKVNEQLSASHRRAATVQLSFEFPFYGHFIKNVTIATGGFLYTGDYVHSWLAATQYIAPLMANFDTSISNDSYIRYVDNGTAFTVEWEKVALKDEPNVGEFTFQTTLHKNGDIVFVYQNVPLLIENIDDRHHPVKVGLSDAYIINRTMFLVRRKTIYEYHRIHFAKEDIKNWTVIYLTALPTCLQNEDCSSCTTSNIPLFDCQWCSSLNRCSNGVDRNRQDWLTKDCEKKHVTNESSCSHISGPDIFDDSNITYNHDKSQFQHQMEEGSTRPVKMGVSSIVAILFLIAMVAGLAVWVLYAYRNPHTTSGQILIRYRPSQWRWRRGEARYTAATIHM